MQNQDKRIKGNRELSQKEIDQMSESLRCLQLSQDHLQTGGMWLVRSVALPDSF